MTRGLFERNTDSFQAKKILKISSEPSKPEKSASLVLFSRYSKFSFGLFLRCRLTHPLETLVEVIRMKLSTNTNDIRLRFIADRLKGIWSWIFFLFVCVVDRSVFELCQSYENWLKIEVRRGFEAARTQPFGSFVCVFKRSSLPYAWNISKVCCAWQAKFEHKTARAVIGCNNKLQEARNFLNESTYWKWGTHIQCVN